MSERKTVISEKATLEQIPDIGFYGQNPSEAQLHARNELSRNPDEYIIFEFWGHTDEEKELYVPLIGVLVGDQMVNLDRRSGLGKRIYDRYLSLHGLQVEELYIL